MSRVANALRALKDADPSRPASMVAPLRDSGEKQRAEPWTLQQSEIPEVNRAVTRKSRTFSAPRVVEIEKPKEPLPRPHSSATSPVIADTLKQQASRRAPASLILTVVPKAAKPEMVDVSSPLTTKPASGLPDLEPLSPFGATFSENGGSFLVYQPKETVITDTPLVLSPGPNETSTPVRSLSPMIGTARRSDQFTPKSSKDYFTRSKSKVDSTISQEMDRSGEVTAQNKSEHESSEEGSRRRTRSIPAARLSQNSESDGTDAQSDKGMSPLFEISGAQSSRTSLGQPSHGGRKQSLSNRMTLADDDFTDLGFTSVKSEFGRQTHSVDGVSPVISPLQHPADEYPYLEEEHSVSPIGTPPALALPKRMSSLPPAHEETSHNKRHSIARKPIGSGVFEGSFQDSTIRQIFSTKPNRHDSTGFTVAREYIRDSIDSEHVRHVHTAAKLSVDHGTSPQTMAPQLQKLTTSMARPGKVEEIADGICLIDSDSPIASKSMSRLPAAMNGSFREPSYTKEFIPSPEKSRHNSTIENLDSTRLSPHTDTLNQYDSGDLDVPSAGLQRTPSRERANTDAIVTSLSSRPDYRARPLIQDAAEMSVSPSTQSRPRTAGAWRSSQPSPVPPPPTKMPSKITFPPRANMAELNAMSPESIRLLQEQESLLRRRYDAVLNPIDNALMKRSSVAPLEIGPDGLRIPSPSHSSQSQSRSRDLRISVGAMSTTDLDLMRHQENIEREQAAIRAQRRNLGAAARRPSAPLEGGLSIYSPMRVDQRSGVYGGHPGLATAFTSPVTNTKSAFTFDDDTQVTRKRRSTWKFWKKK